MSIRDTSLTAYQKTYITGNAGHKRFKVYDCVKKYPSITRQQITDRTGIPINVVTPRVQELIEANLIRENGKNGNKYMLECIG